MDKGWSGWAMQAVELHTFRADMENRRKEGKGFHKLNEESIATVREDLALDYQALADQHCEELTQLTEEFREFQEEIFRPLMEISNKNQRVEELKRVGAIIVSVSVSTEQNDPQPNDGVVLFRFRLRKEAGPRGS